MHHKCSVELRAEQIRFHARKKNIRAGTEEAGMKSISIYTQSQVCYFFVHMFQFYLDPATSKNEHFNHKLDRTNQIYKKQQQ